MGIYPVAVYFKAINNFDNHPYSGSLLTSHRIYQVHSLKQMIVLKAFDNLESRHIQKPFTQLSGFIRWLFCFKGVQ